VLVTGPVDDAEGKARGAEPELVEDLLRLPGRPIVLNEADGSRMRPFKAPAEHEPVIPAATTLVVPVVGADVFGAPLGPERVHRPERVAALAGSALGDPVTPELVARVLTHPEGGLKHVPPGARVIPLINKADTPEALALARETALRLLAEPRVEAVAIGALRAADANPVREVWGRVAAVVLAAGRSTRMGQLKQTLPWGDGQTLLSSVVAGLRASAVSEVVVVTGQARAEVEACLAEVGAGPGPALRFAFNPDFAATEMARSLQVGLAALPANCQAALVALADQPDLDAAVVAQVIQRWRQTRAAVVAPFYHGQRGHPLLFDRALWPAIHALPPSANPRAVLPAAGTVEQVAVDSAAVLRDIDTPEDYARARAPQGQDR
jgi:molybdenum cofactor cytidylyltransferase